MTLLKTYDREQMIAKMAEIGYGESWGPINLYICEHDPMHAYWTIDRVKGTTPFLISCDACDGINMARSMGYRAGEVPEDLCTYEWDFPTNEQFEQLPPNVQHHVMSGGLIKRRLRPDRSPAIGRHGGAA